MIKYIDANVIYQIKYMCGEFTDDGFMIDYQRVLSILTSAESIYLCYCEECDCCTYESSEGLYKCNKKGIEHFMYDATKHFCSYGQMHTLEDVKRKLHEAVDNTSMAEDVYPNLKEKMHQIIDEYNGSDECSFKE